MGDATESPTTQMHRHTPTGLYVFVDDHRVRGWRVDGDEVTMEREGAYWDQLEEGAREEIM